MSLLSATSRRSHATIVVATYMEGFLLSRDAYTRIVHEYPDFRRYIQTVARLRLKREAAHASELEELEPGEFAPPSRESIVLLEKLEAATSDNSAPAAQAASTLPLTKQDKAAERLVRKLGESPACSVRSSANPLRSRRTSTQSMSEMWRASKARASSVEKRPRASSEKWQQDPASAGSAEKTASSDVGCAGEGAGVSSVLSRAGKAPDQPAGHSEATASAPPYTTTQRRVPTTQLRRTKLRSVLYCTTHQTAQPRCTQLRSALSARRRLHVPAAPEERVQARHTSGPSQPPAEAQQPSTCSEA